MNIQGIKLLLVEDSSVLVERIAELILQIPEIELIRVADSEVAALTELRKQPIHIVVLDLQLKVGTGFGILPQINHDSSSSQDFRVTVKHTKGAESG